MVSNVSVDHGGANQVIFDLKGDAIAEMREKLNEGCSQCRDGEGPCAEHIAIAIGVLTAWMDVACEYGRCAQ